MVIKVTLIALLLLVTRSYSFTMARAGRKTVSAVSPGRCYHVNTHFFTY